MDRSLFKNLLVNLRNVGIQPEVYAFSTYRNDFEKLSLQAEAEQWKPFVKTLEYTSIRVSNNVGSKKLPHAQDSCLVMNLQKPSAILAKTLCDENVRDVRSEVESLLKKAGLEVITLKGNYRFEGGFTYACSENIFCSNIQDAKILKTLGQEPVTIPNPIGKLYSDAAYVMNPTLPPILTSNEEHLDLLLSIFEKDGVHHIFIADFADFLLDPNMPETPTMLMKKRLAEYDISVERIKKTISKHVKNAVFHKVPSAILLDDTPATMAKVGNPEISIYSGANLLYTSAAKDYAFYLKFPKETEELMDIQINQEIESVLKEAGIVPIAVSDSDESNNLGDILDSAGTRCLVKVLARENI